jgi:signal transduction histidine kinase
MEPGELVEARGAETFELAQGSVVARTSPYAPLFAQEEFELLRSLGGFALLAYERKSLVAQERMMLEEADQLKTNFIALASHELRTPAAVIHGIASTLHLRGEQLDDEQVHDLRRTLYEQTDRMRRLVDQLLDLSRLEANGIRIEPQPLHVLTRVQELVELVAGEQAQGVIVRVPPDLEAAVDPNAFDRIVSNLIANATYYGAAPIEITARAARPPFPAQRRGQRARSAAGVRPTAVRALHAQRRGAPRDERGSRPGPCDRQVVRAGPRRRPPLRTRPSARRAFPARPAARAEQPLSFRK